MTTTDLWDTLRRITQHLGVIEDELYDRAIERDELASAVGDIVKTLEDLMEHVEEVA